jgi:DNA polymerase mu
MFPAAGPTKIHILQAKIDTNTITELYSLIDSRRTPPYLVLSPDPSDADIIVTNIRMRKRFTRHMDWNIAVGRIANNRSTLFLFFSQQQKEIVTPEWLKDSITQQTLLPCAGYAALRNLPHETRDDSPDRGNSMESSVISPLTPCYVPGQTDNSTSEKVKLNYTSRYACTRASPLVCPNQSLITQLEVLRLFRELEGKDINALAYARAIAVRSSCS